MHVASLAQSEIRTTIEVSVDMVNSLDRGDLDARSALHESGFVRAARASQASIERFEQRLIELAPLFGQLPGLDEESASRLVNEQLTELPISPSIVEHDGVGPHIHWTPSTATFDDQVIADIVMALAQEICDNGTVRFGHCAADDCQDVFYDSTRNRSRRFCNDPRCASKTHTADHRARKKSKTEKLR